ncbi:MAG: FMN-binding protein [Ruminococcus sp.]|nr:FMN-binding protein [Ruminococcus sp.]
MRKILAAVACALMLGTALCGCGGSANRSYKDGTYTGKSAVYSGDEEGNGNGYGEVTITVQDNKITACEFKTYEENGTLKDDAYGKIDGEIKNQDYYNKAQKAIKGSEEYAKAIIGKSDPGEVDSISGATYSYNQFTDAVLDALDKAAE